MRSPQLPVPTPLQAAETILQLAEAELASANAAITAFKRRNMAVIDGRSAYISASLTNRAELDAELAGLVKASGLAWRAHQAAMKEYARIKTGPTNTGYGGTPE